MQDPKIKVAFETFMQAAGIPVSEFDPEFTERMCRAMMVSFYKYGKVRDAYPEKFDAMSDIRTRAASYRSSGNLWFLVDVANFAMIEAMHPRHKDAHWGPNDADSSPGRVATDSHRLQQVDNAGNRLGGDTFLHIPQDYEEKTP